MPATYVIAALDCPACGEHSPADGSAELVTPLVPGGPTFWVVGESAPQFTWQNVRGWYRVLREPEPDGPIRLLVPWECPSCGTRNWARITFERSVITEVVAVPLDVATVTAAHAVDEEVEMDYRELTGENLFGGAGDTAFRERLLAALAGRG